MAHNFYGSENPSGENIAVDIEKKLLEKMGHDVKVFAYYSDEIRNSGLIGKIRGGVATPWNIWSYKNIQKEISSFSPDIVHVHNTFPLLSPSIFHAIPKNIKRVLTLHNYRLFCPAGIPMRAGQICSKCLDKKNSFPALVHRCYRDSLMATLPLSFSVELHRYIGTWKKKVDGFIALTDFQRKIMVQSGLEENKVWVKPNFYPGSPTVTPWPLRNDEIIFVGRLSKEKGVQTLIQAWKKWCNEEMRVPKLIIVGDGPQKDQLIKSSQGLPIHFAGGLNSSEVQERMSKSKLLIMPSEWWEGFPMVIREAYAFGVPVAASRIGSLEEIVEDRVSGILFEPSNHEDLYQKVSQCWKKSNSLETLGLGARLKFESKYSEKYNYAKLMDIYNQILK